MDINEILQNKENYDGSVEKLTELLLSILEKGEVTENDNEELELLMSKESEQYNYNAQNKSNEEANKELTKEDLINILSDNGRKTVFSIDDDDNVTIDGTAIPSLTILAKKLSLIAQDGEDESSIILTPTLIQLIAESDIQLSAKKILINGLLEGAGWRIDEEGSMDINDLTVRGNLTCESLNVDSLISAGVPIALANTINIHVANGETVTQYLDDIPLNLNGYSVNIYLDADTTENIELRRHMNGIINIYMCGHTVHGTLRGNFNNSIYNIYGGSTSSDTTLGSFMPYTAYKTGSYYYTVIFVNCPNVNIENIKIYGDSINTESSVGLGGTNKSKIDVNNIVFVGCKYNCRTYSMAELYCGSSRGISTNNSWSAGTGSKITLGATTQAGGGNNTYTSNNGEIKSDGVTFATAAEGGSNTSPGTPATTRVETFKPNYADTYRSTKYFDWKKDGVCRQGDWNYGNCNGAWFYGTQFSEVKGKNITKVTITVSRSSGVGNSGDVTHVFQAHTHASRPSGIPNYTTCNKTLSLAWGETGTVTITDSAILNGIKDGTIKGFGIKSSYTSSYYSALTNGTVKIYYTE